MKEQLSERLQSIVVLSKLVTSSPPLSDDLMSQENIFKTQKVEVKKRARKA